MACEQRGFDWIARPAARRAVRGLLLGLAIAFAAIAEAEAQASGAGDPAIPAADPGDRLDVPGRAAPRGAGRSGDPGLDDLLRLPSDFQTRPAERPVAGVSEDEWRGRFARAEKAIGDARNALVETKTELDGLAETGGASQWSVAPPGASGVGQQTTSPLSFKLRQQLKREREALDEAERALRELRIEADLAGVPAEWRVVATSPGPAPTAPN